MRFRRPEHKMIWAYHTGARRPAADQEDVCSFSQHQDKT